MEPEGSLPHSHLLATCHNPGTRQVFIFRYKASSYDEEFLTPRRTSKLEDHPLSATFDCLFNIFAATLHTAGRSSIRNWRRALPWWQGPTYHGVVSTTWSLSDGIIVCIR